jgi:hypothetical protein
MKRAPIILERWDGNVNLTALFAHLSDEIVLDISARDFEADTPEQCLCGWALRESLAQAAGIDADDVELRHDDGFISSDITVQLADRFGGTRDDWSAVYWGITSSGMPVIEAAWTERVMQAAGVLA